LKPLTILTLRNHEGLSTTKDYVDQVEWDFDSKTALKSGEVHGA